MKTLSIQFLKNRKIRGWCLLIFLLLIFSGISALFWYNELIYKLPTSIPVNYKEVKPGAYIDIAQQLKTDPKKPVFLHFFNPDCPCSRFNIQHFKSLAKKYGNELDFIIIALVKTNNYTAQNIRDKFDLDLPVLFDSSLAAACGVYSTPQAVIIDKSTLFFRGNYNKSRYCTDPKSNYAQMAIDSLLNHNYHLSFDHLAFRAYGCQLPACKK